MKTYDEGREREILQEVFIRAAIVEYCLAHNPPGYIVGFEKTAETRILIKICLESESQYSAWYDLMEGLSAILKTEVTVIGYYPFGLISKKEKEKERSNEQIPY